jgi:uncharacterized membrane protein YgcG
MKKLTTTIMIALVSMAMLVSAVPYESKGFTVVEVRDGLEIVEQQQRNSITSVGRTTEPTLNARWVLPQQERCVFHGTFRPTLGFVYTNPVTDNTICYIPTRSRNNDVESTSNNGGSSSGNGNGDNGDNGNGDNGDNGNGDNGNGDNGNDNGSETPVNCAQQCKPLRGVQLAQCILACLN